MEKSLLPSMARNRQLPVVVTAFLLGLLLANPTSAQHVRVCYDRHGNDLPSATEVIGRYKSLNIQKMRIYAPRAEVMQALRGSNIELLLDFPGPLHALAQSPAAADEWVRSNVLAYWPDVRVRYIAVGNEEIFKKGVAEYRLPAMRNIYRAISAAGLQNQIKVSTSVQYSVMGESYPPFAGVFPSEVLPLMRPIVEFLARTGAPLLVNVHPYFGYLGSPWNIELRNALFTATENVVRFNGMVDAVYAALEKVGGGSVGVVVSESRWPSVSGDAATVENATIYNSNVFGMFNEKKKKPAGIANNWGLFNASQMDGPDFLEHKIF